MYDESEIDWQKDCWRGANGSRIWALSRGVHNFFILVQYGTGLGPTPGRNGQWIPDWEYLHFCYRQEFWKEFEGTLLESHFLSNMVLSFWTNSYAEYLAGVKSKFFLRPNHAVDVFNGTFSDTLCLWIKSNVWLVFPIVIWTILYGNFPWGSTKTTIIGKTHHS